MSAPIPPLTWQQMDVVKRRLREYLAIRSREDAGFIREWGADFGRLNQLMADIDHSDLLVRMLVNGEEPAAYPPARA